MIAVLQAWRAYCSLLPTSQLVKTIFANFSGKVCKRWTKSSSPHVALPVFSFTIAFRTYASNSSSSANVSIMGTWHSLWAVTFWHMNAFRQASSIGFSSALSQSISAARLATVVLIPIDIFTFSVAPIRFSLLTLFLSCLSIALYFFQSDQSPVLFAFRYVLNLSLGQNFKILIPERSISLSCFWNVLGLFLLS